MQKYVAYGTCKGTALSRKKQGNCLEFAACFKYIPCRSNLRDKGVQLVHKVFLICAFTLALAAGLNTGGSALALELNSPAFKTKTTIPAKYTCEGPDVSPALKWATPPAGTKGLALICDDPDAPGGTWVHWVIYNIPPDAEGLSENIPRDKKLDSGALQGTNSWGKIGYGGPCPPPGPAHRYFFKLYALDAALDLKPGATKQQVEGAMEGHVLDRAELVGLFSR